MDATNSSHLVNNPGGIPLMDFDFSAFSSMSSDAAAEGSANSLLPPPPLPPASLDYDFQFGSGMEGDAAADLLGGGGAGAGHTGGDMPPPPPPSLLSTTEQTDLLRFLDRFEWEFDPMLPHGMPSFPSMPSSSSNGSGASMSASGSSGGGGQGAPGQGLGGSNTNDAGMGSRVVVPEHHGFSNAMVENGGMLQPSSSSSSHDLAHAFQHTPPTPAATTESSATLYHAPSHAHPHLHPNTTSVISLQPASADSSSQRPSKRRKSSPSESNTLPVNASGNGTSSSAASTAASRKALLTQPQKRLNHIMSEQRRRTAIKEGFATIEHLIAPDPEYTGPPPTLPPPLDKDGKPRKGVKAKSLRGKGKMGSLFRASEFLNHLQEGVGALTLEVERLEAAVRSHGESLMKGEGMYMPGGVMYDGAVGYRMHG